MLMVVIMSASAFFMIMVMMVVMMLVLMVVIMVVMATTYRTHFLFHQFFFKGTIIFHCVKNLCTGEFFNRCSNHSSCFVQTSNNLKCCHYFFFRSFIRSAKNNCSCVFNLITEKLTKVFHIHFTFHCIHYSCKAVEFYINCTLYFLYCFDYIRQFSYS